MWSKEEIARKTQLFDKVLDAASIDRDEARAGVLGIHPYGLLVDAQDIISQLLREAELVKKGNKTSGNVMSDFRAVCEEIEYAEGNLQSLQRYTSVSIALDSLENARLIAEDYSKEQSQ
jgi:hypothetical protein